MVTTSTVATITTTVLLLLRFLLVCPLLPSCSFVSVSYHTCFFSRSFFLLFSPLLSSSSWLSQRKVNGDSSYDFFSFFSGCVAFFVVRQRKLKEEEDELPEDSKMELGEYSDILLAREDAQNTNNNNNINNTYAPMMSQQDLLQQQQQQQRQDVSEVSCKHTIHDTTTYYFTLTTHSRTNFCNTTGCKDMGYRLHWFGVRERDWTVIDWWCRVSHVTCHTIWCWALPLWQLIFFLLNRGNFGVVYKARWRGGDAAGRKIRKKIKKTCPLIPHHSPIFFLSFYQWKSLWMDWVTLSSLTLEKRVPSWVA